MKNPQIIEQIQDISFVKFLSVFIIGGTLLVSCGKQDPPLVIIGTSGALVTTGTIQLPVSITRGNIRHIKPVTSSATSVVVTQEKMMERIKNIATLDDLVTFSPGVFDNPKKDHPKFVELQKKQMLLGIMQSQIQKPEYQELQKYITTIYEAKELWTPEIQTLDTKIQEVMKNIGAWAQSNWTSEELKKLRDRKNALLQKLHTSEEFQKYIEKNQSKLNNLNVEAKKYWTPGMVNLQQEITDLSREVYGAPVVK